jgi:hypothetical protein
MSRRTALASAMKEWVSVKERRRQTRKEERDVQLKLQVTLKMFDGAHVRTSFDEWRKVLNLRKQTELRHATVTTMLQRSGLLQDESLLRSIVTAWHIVTESAERFNVAKIEEIASAARAFLSGSPPALAKMALIEWRKQVETSRWERRVAHVLHKTGILGDAPKLRSYLISWHAVVQELLQDKAKEKHNELVMKMFSGQSDSVLLKGALADWKKFTEISKRDKQKNKLNEAVVKVFAGQNDSVLLKGVIGGWKKLCSEVKMEKRRRLRRSGFRSSSCECSAMTVCC